ncbi:LacI family DNA-binding transcriptional regulator [Streptomyces oryzae]|uniref:LacI family DNA-binding transcriptional regulator n=1 Tax=Streptomyces oryzae TaxID=1434886 RepID=A0ABS3XDG7_9ACTN|nr:LacI family DNA-binding transcriptional regulator [Streptomyces oryzae]MBO8193420.1 LacI family DNA-binding transcriptional regulator [Streptomyces oryzae]
MSRATIYDVAERAQVSISTVSLALNAPSKVRATTLSRIMTAIDELGFTPRAEAASRARKRLGRIGVMAPFTTYPTFARRLEGVLEAVNGLEYEVVVHDQISAAAAAPVLAGLPLTHRLDGLIVMSLPLAPDVAGRLRGKTLPTVLVELARAEFSSVSIDDAAGGRLVAEELTAAGHTRFGFVGETQAAPDFASQCQERLAGFRAGLRDAAGADLPDSRVRLVENSVDAAAQAAGELLDAEEPPTAVFAHDDYLAAGVLRAARARGLRIPGDLAVVGFDDGDLAEALDLTTVRQPFRESGRVAAQILLDRVREPDRPIQSTRLELSYVRRGTA